MGRHWSGPISWETDALFYQAKTEEIERHRRGHSAPGRSSAARSPTTSATEAEAPDEPPRVSDPAWVEYSSAFYARRLLLPAVAAALSPILGAACAPGSLAARVHPGSALLFLLLRRSSRSR